MDKDKIWQPIATAPAHIELEVSIYDNDEYHTLVFPCRYDGSGWWDVRAGRPMPLKPTHWRLWKGRKEDK
jgi:hypothetical protein